MKRKRRTNVVKARRMRLKKQQFLNDLEEAVQELNDIKAGRKQGRPIKEFLKELREMK